MSVDTLPERFNLAIREFLENLRKNFENGEIEVYLFGSLARGDYLLDSDVDIIVVSDSLKNRKPWERTSRLRKLASRKVGFDIVGYTKEEFEKVRHLWGNLVRIL